MSKKPILVFQTDFTYKEGAVCSMYGVVKTVDRDLEIITGTHEIPKFDIWSASYRLYQYMRFWPKGTIFISVVDPGVGTSRKSAAARTSDGYFVITPDNGTLTHITRFSGIREIREIDENINRLKGFGTEEVNVFHGRDIFAFCAAGLASGKIDFTDLGPEYPKEDIISFPLKEPGPLKGGIKGNIDIRDPNFGNIWTNISMEAFSKAGFSFGETINVNIIHGNKIKLDLDISFCGSFGYEEKGKPLIYNNELMNISLAVSLGSFTEKFGIGYGPEWIIEFRKTTGLNSIKKKMVKKNI